MDPDDQALNRHLFARATAWLEDAHSQAIQGQERTLDRATARRLAIALYRAADDLAALARAVRVIAADPDDSSPGNCDV